LGDSSLFYELTIKLYLFDCKVSMLVNPSDFAGLIIDYAVLLKFDYVFLSDSISSYCSSFNYVICAISA
jgi:hypothetical protein